MMNSIAEPFNPADPLEKPYACLFPGSTSVYVGMGQSLSKQFDEAARLFTKANEILGFDIRQICFNGGIVQLNKTKHALLAVYITSCAYFEILKQILPRPPCFFAGHSLGEYSALTAAGALTFEEGLKVVQYRAQIAEDASALEPSGMTIVKGICSQEIEKICSLDADQNQGGIGCYNSPDQIMLSGTEARLRIIEKAILDKYPSASIIPLVSSPPFHSPLLKAQAVELHQFLMNRSWGRFTAPVIANATGRPYQTKDEALEVLPSQLFKPVQWMESMGFIYSRGIETVFEVGPQTVLKLLNRNPKMRFISFDDPADRKLILSLIKSASV